MTIGDIRRAIEGLPDDAPVDTETIMRPSLGSDHILEVVEAEVRGIHVDRDAAAPFLEFHVVVGWNEGWKDVLRIERRSPFFDSEILDILQPLAAVN
jgi:hypothetical protein